MNSTQLAALPADNQPGKSTTNQTQESRAPVVLLTPGVKTAPKAIPIDKVCWKSDDDLVVIKQLVKLAQKHPPSDYPCIVIQAFPREHERIRSIRGGIELMLTYQEAEEFVTALNVAAETQGKGQLYRILQRIPPKSKARKQKWKQFNARRLTDRSRWSSPTWARHRNAKNTR